MSESTLQVSRFVGLDVHKSSVLIGAVDAQPQVILRPFRLSWDKFELWIQQKRLPTDAVVLESTTHAWHLYDQLIPWVASVSVANPLLIKWISSTNVTPALAGGARETDGHDTLKLARLLAAGLIPLVWVPPEPLRQLRALISHRQRLIRQRPSPQSLTQSAPPPQPHPARGGALRLSSTTVVARAPA